MHVSYKRDADAALEALNCPESQLASVLLLYPDDNAMQLLSPFTSLTSCTLSIHGELDLQPLHSLPHLDTLAVEKGSFLNFNACQHLTKLVIHTHHSQSEPSCMFAHKLRSLDLFSLDQFHHLHHEALLACTALEHLALCARPFRHSFRSSMIEAGLNPYLPYNIQAALTSLTLLTSLQIYQDTSMEHFYVDYRQELAVDVDWVTCLTSLRDLEVRVTWCPFILPAGLNRLSMLTRLALVTRHTASVKLDVCDWPACHSLQKVYFGSGSYSFDHQLLKLAEVAQLSEITFGFDCFDKDCKAILASVPERFKKIAPNVKVHFHDSKDEHPVFKAFTDKAFKYYR